MKFSTLPSHEMSRCFSVSQLKNIVAYVVAQALPLFHALV